MASETVDSRSQVLARRPGDNWIRQCRVTRIERCWTLSAPSSGRPSNSGELWAGLVADVSRETPPANAILHSQGLHYRPAKQAKSAVPFTKRASRRVFHVKQMLHCRGTHTGRGAPEWSSTTVRCYQRPAWGFHKTTTRLPNDIG
jgi:hypothetical protein